MCAQHGFGQRQHLGFCKELVLTSLVIDLIEKMASSDIFFFFFCHKKVMWVRTLERTVIKALCPHRDWIQPLLRPQFNSWVRIIHWRRDRLPTLVFLCFPCDSAVKEFACNAGDLGWIPGLGRFPWRREKLSTPVFWPGESYGLYSSWGRK